MEAEGDEAFSRKKRTDRKAVNSGGEPASCVVSRAQEGLLSGSKKAQQPRSADSTGKNPAKNVGRAEANPEKSLKAAGIVVQETETDDGGSIEKEKPRKHSSKKKRTFDFV